MSREFAPASECELACQDAMRHVAGCPLLPCCDDRPVGHTEQQHHDGSPCYDLGCPFDHPHGGPFRHPEDGCGDCTPEGNRPCQAGCGPVENAEAPGVIHTGSPCENEHERPVHE